MPKDRPTILQIVPQLDAGGAELSAVEIAEAIVRAGGRALVLAEPGGRLAPRVTAAGGEVIAFPAATKNPLACWPTPRAIARMVGRRRRRSDPRPQPGAGVERPAGGAAGTRCRS